MANQIRDRKIPSDKQLMERARDGDVKAFEDLICRHHTSCVTIAASILRDWAEAQDVVQNAYWQAYNHLDQYRDEPNADGQHESADHGQRFLAWLLRIVKNQCLMLIRAKRRMPLVYIDADFWRSGNRPVELPANEADVERGFLQREMIDVLQKEIRRIPPLLRNVLQLCDMEEMPMLDVAKQLRITVPAVKSRLLRARRELRARVIVRCKTHQPGRSSSRRSNDKRASLTNSNVLAFMQARVGSLHPNTQTR